MYYYAKVDVNNIVQEVVEEVEPVDETGWIEIDSYNMDLVGLWYNVNTQTFLPEGQKYLIPMKAVDGAGSGLDADKLDGNEASAFALVNHTHTGFADENHTHSEYASATHNHDEDYAPLGHTHTEFASATHDHDDDYAPLSHAHSQYANASHNHDSAYAAKSHTHDYATSGHNHDSDYLKLSGGTIDGHVNVTGSYKMDDYAIITNGNNDSIIFGSANKPTVINGLSTADLIMYGAGCWIPSIKPRGGNGTQTIGTPTYRFSYAYLQNSPNVSSDERLKQDIESVKNEDMLTFIDKLNVVNYAFKDDPETKRIGLLAQEVEKAGGEKYVDIDEEGMYGLKTADLVYPLIGAVQALYARVMELEAKVKE